MLQSVPNIVPPSAGATLADRRAGLLIAQASPSKRNTFGTWGTEEQGADLPFGCFVLQSRWCRPETGLKWGVGLPYSSVVFFFFSFFPLLQLQQSNSQKFPTPKQKVSGGLSHFTPVALAGLATTRPAAGEVLSDQCLSLSPPEQMTMPGI